MGANGSNGDGARPIIFERPLASDDYARADGRVDWPRLFRAQLREFVDCFKTLSQAQNERILTAFGEFVLKVANDMKADANLALANVTDENRALAARVAKLERDLASRKSSDAES